MSNFSKILGGTAVALTLIAGATQASAAFISEWGYEVQSGFSAFAPDAAIPAGVEGTNPNAVTGDPTLLSWGTGSGGPSQLEIEETVTNPPNLFTNGANVAGASMIHRNRIIDGDDATLVSATISSILTLTPITPPGADVGPIPVSFDITFEETPNNGDCVDDALSNCDDIFVLTNPEALSFDFAIMGFLYTVTLNVEGLGTLDDDACLAAGAASGCTGFLTQEELTNTLFTNFGITGQPIPEPSTLALLGLGLLGLGIVRRRKVTA